MAILPGSGPRHNPPPACPSTARRGTTLLKTLNPSLSLSLPPRPPPPFRHFLYLDLAAGLAPLTETLAPDSLGSLTNDEDERANEERPEGEGQDPEAAHHKEHGEVRRPQCRRPHHLFHCGGGSKRLQRTLDLKRNTAATGVVERIEYGPNRSSRLAFVRWIDGVNIRRRVQESTGETKETEGIKEIRERSRSACFKSRSSSEALRIP